MFPFGGVSFFKFPFFIELETFLSFLSPLVFFMISIEFSSIILKSSPKLHWIHWIYTWKQWKSSSYPESSWCFFLWPLFSSYSPSWPSVPWWPFFPSPSLYESENKSKQNCENNNIVSITRPNPKKKMSWNFNVGTAI